jgi:hypothetical protein
VNIHDKKCQGENNRLRESSINGLYRTGGTALITYYSSLGFACPPLAGVARFSGSGVDVLQIGSSGLKLSPVSCFLVFHPPPRPPPKGDICGGVRFISDKNASRLKKKMMDN